jgi:hypothetical protein
VIANMIRNNRVVMLHWRSSKSWRLMKLSA